MFSNYGASFSESTPRREQGCWGSCGFTFWELSLLVVSALEIAFLTTATIHELAFIAVDAHLYQASLAINVTIIILLAVSSLYFVCGLFWEKPQELCIFVVSLLSLTFYIILEYGVIGGRDWLKLARLCVAAIGTPLIALLAKKSSTRFNEMRIVGASEGLLSMYKTLCYLLALLRLDLQFGIIFAVFSFGIKLHSEYTNIPTACLVMGLISGYAFIEWIVGKLAISKEWKRFVFVYMALSTLSLLWVPFQLMLSPCYWPEHCTAQDMLLSYSSLAGATMIVVTQIYIYIELLKAYRNFGYGLTDRAFVRLVSTESTSLLAGSRVRTLNF